MKKPLNAKSVCFKQSVIAHADLKIRLEYDEIRQQTFFEWVVKAYVNRDEDMVRLVDRHKKEYRVQTAGRRKKTQEDYMYRKETEKRFALRKDEIENIFDLIEETE